MATFSIVMRCLRQCSFRLQSSNRALSNIHIRNGFYHVRICTFSHQKSYVRLFMSSSSLLDSQTTQQTQVLTPVGNQRSSSDSSSKDGSVGDGKKEDPSSGDKSGSDKQRDSWWRGKNSWRLGLIFIGGVMTAWGVGLVSIWGKKTIVYVSVRIIIIIL